MSRVAPFQSWLATILLALLLAACGRSDPAKTDDPKKATVADTPALAAGEFGLARLESEQYENRPAALLTFSKPLASAQKFDELLAITGDGGKAPDGSWVLDAGDPKRLRFPYLEADKTFRITLKAGLSAADGSTLGKAATREVYTGPLEPVAGFASQGSVLPAHDTRGLPVVTVNVPELDVEFLRVKDADLPKFLANYTANGRRSYWSLDELSKFAQPVYANRFALDIPDNQRGLSYLPIRDIEELKAPGLYFAVMRRPGKFDYESDTATFFVSDLGVHARAYGNALLVHAASLESGSPLGGVNVELRDKDGVVVKHATTDGDGLAKFDGYKLDSTHVLVATRNRDISMVPFNQPALDLSEFSIAGRAQRALEIFPWSGRDLYRPGETVRVAALLRDFDGRMLPAAQPVFVALKAPDGRVIVSQELASNDLGEFEFAHRLAEDASLGRWSVEFATVPITANSQPSDVTTYPIRVEEFLPERLKLELTTTAERLAPGDVLPLVVDADYLYGAPAAGNRFTARMLLSNDVHPVEALNDFRFGDELVDLPKESKEILDEVLDAEGRLETDVTPFEGEAPKTPVAIVLTGSVFETGGRAVTRTLKRTMWPANELVGIRPLFDMTDGSSPNSNAGFEVVRINAAGELLAAQNLKVRLVREVREYHWRFEPGSGWRTDYIERLENVVEQDLAFAAGQRGKLSFPVEWGGYRVEIEDPATGLVTRMKFTAGWSWDDDNQGTSARPDKVKLALDRTHYRGGETLKVTITPPHDGPALLLLESDTLLWHDTIQAKAGTVVEIPLDKAWERHDLYLTAIVFRPGSVPKKITPNRAVGIVHVPIARVDRSSEATLTAPETMRPKQKLAVNVKAPAFAGQKAMVRITAVDLGVLNITNFKLPDASDWFFAPRRLAIDAYDLYGRVVETYEGERARLRYGGDAALATLPSAKRPNAGIETVDLVHAPVALDAQGNAVVELAVPDFNGTLRIRGLVYSADRYASGETDTIVRAPLVVEASTPRVLAPGDASKVTLDLQNLSGQPGTFAVKLTATGPVTMEKSALSVTLKDQEKQTVAIGLSARGTFGVGEIRAQVTGPEVDLDRRFRFVVRPAWPSELRTSTTVLQTAAPIVPDVSLQSNLVPESMVARITVGTLPPLPFGAAVKGLFGYPYGCIEQTSSKAFPLVWLDDETADRFGVTPIPAAERQKMLGDAFARIASMQVDSGHYSMWPGDSWVNTQMTPFVSELFLNARDAGYAIPEETLNKSLDRLNEDLLSGGNGHYEYDHAEHLRLAEMAYSGYVLARVKKAPVGTLRAIFDNEKEKFEGPLPLAHLAVAFKLMGDQPRADAALEEAFTRKFTRPDYLGDYGTQLRDVALMVALTHENGMAKPHYDTAIIDLAREMFGRGGSDGIPDYLSTQEQTAIFRLGRSMLKEKGRTFGASISVAGAVEERTGQQLVSRSFDADQLRAGVRITPNGTGPFYVTQDVAGIPKTAPEPSKDGEQLRIRRTWHLPDGTAFRGDRIREGDVLVAHIAVDSGETMNDALVVDLLPGGLEIENLNLTDPAQWQNVTIDGITLSERSGSAEIRHEEYRDDRYVAALKIWGGSTTHLFYLVRAVSPGGFVVPPASVEDMYRPTLRAFSDSRPKRVNVVAPGTAIPELDEPPAEEEKPVADDADASESDGEESAETP